MSGASTVIVALLLALVAMSFAFAGGAVIVALPLAALGIAAVGLLDVRRRRKQAQDVHEFRDQAQSEKVDFTERDKQTLTSE